MDNIFKRRLNSKRMQVFRFWRTRMEADDYGDGKSDTGICHRIGNQAGYGNLLDIERYVNMCTCNRAHLLDSVDILIRPNMVVFQ